MANRTYRERLAIIGLESVKFRRLFGIYCHRANTSAKS